MMFGSRIVREHRKWLSLLILILPVSIAAQQPGDNSQPKSTEQRAITGRVIGESGQPLPGVNIFISAVGASSGQQTATDSEGNFRAQGLDPGTYRLFANAPAYVPETPLGDANFPPTYYRPGDSATLTLIKGGVIAGIVTNNAGEPLVNATVRAFRVRDSEGKPLRSGVQSRERVTDDRGYYRIYGLQPGSYIVSAGGSGQGSGVIYVYGINAYARQAPTYAPASTRDTAVEIIVRSGEQATADIHDRGDFGHSISGRVSGVATQLPFNSGVRLMDPETHAMIANTGATGDDRTFQLNGVSDGDYEISALAGAGPNADLAVSPARRVSVRSADVTGIELTLATLGSISGRVNIEADAKLACGRHRDVALRETMITIRRDRVDPDTKNPKDKSVQPDEPAPFLPTFIDSAPNDKGEINLRNLYSGVYRVETRLPGGGWYVKAITTGANSLNIPRDGLALKSSDKVTGLNVTITEGGARLLGRISVAEGQRLPPGLRVYVVPAERESAENVLRFYEAPAADDGSFGIGNIAPGKYWIIARPAEESEAGKIKSIKQDATLRAKVLREAEGLKKEIPLKPCEQSNDYDLPWPSATRP